MRIVEERVEGGGGVEMDLVMKVVGERGARHGKVAYQLERYG